MTTRCPSPVAESPKPLPFHQCAKHLSKVVCVDMVCLKDIFIQQFHLATHATFQTSAVLPWSFQIQNALSFQPFYTNHVCIVFFKLHCHDPQHLTCQQRPMEDTALVFWGVFFPSTKQPDLRVNFLEYSLLTTRDGQ